MPELKPSSSMTSTLGLRRLTSTRCQPGRSRTASEVMVVVHRERRMVGEARRRRDRARLQAVPQRGRDELVVDAPADVLGARGATVAPPGVVLAFLVQVAVR